MTRIDEELEKQSERALALTRAAREASPEDARRLGEIAAGILHRVVSQRRLPDPRSADPPR
jgi:hypothetical protein